jgi:hypothetical protein
MHFALPPRKTSHPPPYARAAAARNSSDRRRKLYQLGSYVVFGILTIYLIFHYVFSSRRAGEEEIESIPPGTPPVVIVTVLDEEHMSPNYIKKIKTNREDYASRHGNPPHPTPPRPPKTKTSPPLQAIKTSSPTQPPISPSIILLPRPGHSSPPSATPYPSTRTPLGSSLCPPTPSSPHPLSPSTLTSSPPSNPSCSKTSPSSLPTA